MSKRGRPLVLHYVWKYLFITGIWIHSQIAFLRRYHPVVVTREMENLDLFPISRIHGFPRCNRPGKIADLLNFLIRRSRLDRLVFLMLVCWYRPELIHVHFGDSGWENLFLKRVSRKKYIVSFYGYDYGSLLTRNPAWSKRYRLLFEKGDAFIVEGAKARSNLASLGCPEEKIFENHLGVDVSQIEFSERNHPGVGEAVRLLQAATFVEKKGHRFTVYALAEALEKVPTLSLTFVGSGELKTQIEQLVRDLGLENQVTFLPPLPYGELMSMARLHHIFIQPSVHASDGDCEGGAPVVLLDMQASGMPVIATRHCDIPEYVQDRITGFLVDEKNIHALAERIAYLATHKELWPLMGRQGREHVCRHYNAQTQAEKLEEIYDKVVGNEL